MRAVGIRELKNKLSEYLRLVAAGETVLVTDRGTVVAELRSPSGVPEGPWTPLMSEWASQGKLRLGGPNRADLYPDRPLGASAGTALRLLDEDRGDR